MAYSKRYNRTVGVAQMILEGKSEREISEEYGIHRNTVTNDIKYLLEYARTDEHFKLAKKAHERLEKRASRQGLNRY